MFLILYALILLANLVLIAHYRAWFWWLMNLAVASQPPVYLLRKDAHADWWHSGARRVHCPSHLRLEP